MAGRLADKPLTRKEKAFVSNVVYDGMSPLDSYKRNIDYKISLTEEQIAERAEKLIYKPHVRRYYDELMEDVRQQNVKHGAWNLETATDRLKKLADVAAEEIDAHGITMARASALTSAAKELNLMHGLNKPIDLNLTGSVGVTIIEDELPD